MNNNYLTFLSYLLTQLLGYIECDDLISTSRKREEVNKIKTLLKRCNLEEHYRHIIDKTLHYISIEEAEEDYEKENKH